MRALFFVLISTTTFASPPLAVPHSSAPNPVPYSWSQQSVQRSAAEDDTYAIMYGQITVARSTADEYQRLYEAEVARSREFERHSVELQKELDVYKAKQASAAKDYIDLHNRLTAEVAAERDKAAKYLVQINALNARLATCEQ